MKLSSDDVQPSRVPLVDLSRQHAALWPEIHEACARVSASGQFILGPEVEGFEGEVARYLGVAHAIGVSSGTDALVVALAAVGVRAGDRVIAPAFSFFATAGAILRLGAVPVFVDVEPSTLTMDPEQLAGAIDGRTRAIVPVHLYGHGPRMDGILAVASEHAVPVVEDAAQAFSARQGGRAAGTWGAAGCFSFFPSKILGAMGDGGLVVTNEAEVAARCRLLREHGARAKSDHTELGGNYRLDALQAAILRAKLRHVDEFSRLRRERAARYDEAFAREDRIRRCPAQREPTAAAASYTIRVPSRDELRTHLTARGIQTAVYYPRPLHQQPAVLAAGVRSPTLPVAESASADVLSIPLFPEMTDAEQEEVIASVLAFFEA